jgi:ribonuclease T2
MQRGVLSVFLLSIFVLSCQAFLPSSRLPSKDESGTAQRTEIQQRSTNGTWDLLLLVEQWAIGVCLTTPPPCAVPSVVTNYFTLHGLWPNNNDGSYPSYCNSNAFDITQLTSIQTELDDYWPDLYSADSTSFWSHEWDKHGTCAQSLPALSTELDFFSQTLNLRAQYDLYTALWNAGIKPDPSNTYTSSQFSTAISNAFGVQPLMSCGTDTGGNSILVQVALCINKNLQVEVCPSAVVSQGIGTTCNQFLYPPLQNGTVVAPSTGTTSTTSTPDSDGSSSHLQVVPVYLMILSLFCLLFM